MFIRISLDDALEGIRIMFPKERYKNQGMIY